jgi:hypothetical protein
MDNINSILTLLMNANVRLNLNKCVFGVNAIRYLGYVVDGNGISFQPERVQSVLNIRPPHNVRSLQRFLECAINLEHSFKFTAA